MQKKDFGNRIFYTCGSIGSSLIYTLVSGFYMFFLTQIQALNSVVVGTAFMLTRIWDAVNDPLMGIIIQKTRSKFGRNKPWMLAGSILNFIFLVLMFVNVNFGTTGKYVYYFTTYIIWGMCYTMVDVAYWGMLPNIVTTKEEKAEYSSLSQIGSALGTFSVTVLFPILLAKFFANTYSGKGYFVIALSIAIISLVFFLTCTFYTKEVKKTKPEKFNFKQAIKILFTNKSFIAITLFYLCIHTAICLTTGFGLYYFSFDLGDFSFYATFALVAGVGQVISTLCYPYIIKFFSQRNIVIFALISTMINYLILFMVSCTPNSSKVLICIFGFMAMFGFGWLLVYKMIAVTDVVFDIYKEKKKYYNNIIVSAQTFATKLSSAVSAILIGVILEVVHLTGIDPNSNIKVNLTNTDLYLMRILIFIVPVLLMGLATLLYIYMYKLNKKENLLRDKFILEKSALTNLTNLIEEPSQPPSSTPTKRKYTKKNSN